MSRAASGLAGADPRSSVSGSVSVDGTGSGATPRSPASLPLRRSVEMSRSTPRERILKAALSVFAEKGIHGATIEEIATAAGYTPGAIYKHFKNKEALGKEAGEVIERELAELFAEELPFRVRVDDHLRWLLGRFVARIEQRQNLFRSLIVHQAMGEEGYRSRARFLARLELIMQRGIDAGELAPRSARSLASALSGISNAFIVDWLMGGGAESLTAQDVVEEIVTLFMQGAAAPAPAPVA